ncbi:efflux RND transporter periplasmic adaptor subunit [Roseateles oligotrophus]|uniref:Efflux RND transporter periplasmic adaptor subunit n=1 Tax=Roseateles oligotrophus TaxID=1769250 RepID=A0ABT2YG21_9BURK|nr:efflux RND transporter periplasmic adaptor subunit [Roseateles oligotrophus]MCV2369000.1 efflux RND transporter periplasmic adaptor subunit [Roseateles oligotrophus]
MARPFLPALPVLLALVAAIALSSCGKDSGKKDTAADAAQAAKSATPLLIAPEDQLSMSMGTFSSGPVITGSIQPEKRADLRAEVSAVVLQVLKENGETVKRGDLLARLDDNSIREQLTSADESARVSAQSFEQAERQYQRLKTLQSQGMSSLQATEDAEQRRNNAQGDLVAAKARAAQARQQLQRTEVRAPFDGIISERKVSAGDTALVGKELFKVMDPRSMRFEGLVSADRMSDLKIGQTVTFRVNGLDEKSFDGKIRRIEAAANATTRQLEVLVDFAPGASPKVAGLYAEGRVESGSVSTLMLPDSAAQRAGDEAFVWLINGDLLKKTSIKLGERDARRGEFVVLGGLKAGDRILRKPGSNLQDGQKIQLVASAQASIPAGAAKAEQVAAAASTGK